MMHIVRMIVVGLIVGIIARFVYPGAVHMSWLMNAVLGIAGSFVGGLIGNLFSKPADGQFLHPAGFVMSVIGAMILIFLCRTVLNLNF